MRVGTVRSQLLGPGRLPRRGIDGIEIPVLSGSVRKPLIQKYSSSHVVVGVGGCRLNIPDQLSLRGNRNDRLGRCWLVLARVASSKIEPAPVVRYGRPNRTTIDRRPDFSKPRGSGWRTRPLVEPVYSSWLAVRRIADRYRKRTTCRRLRQVNHAVRRSTVGSTGRTR